MLRKSKVVISQPLEDDKVLETGVVVQTVTPLQEITRADHLRKAHDWFEAKYNVTVDDFLNGFKEATKRDSLTLEQQKMWDSLTMLGGWSTFMSATSSLVHRTLDGDKAGAWEYEPVPEGWKDFETCVNDLPSVLLTKAVDEIHKLNPNLWIQATDEEQKKIVHVTETL